MKKIKDGEDIEAIKKATEELSQEAQKIGQELYAAAQEADKAKAGEPASSADGAKSEEKKDEKSDVKEGEVVDEGEKK